MISRSSALTVASAKSLEGGLGIYAKIYFGKELKPNDLVNLGKCVNLSKTNEENGICVVELMKKFLTHTDFDSSLHELTLKYCVDDYLR